MRTRAIDPGAGPAPGSGGVPARASLRELREISQRYGLGMTEQLLKAAIEARQLRGQATRPLATILIRALDEAAMSIANSDDPVQETDDVRAVVHALIDGLLTRSRRRSRD
jgi:hypothetical protein